LETPFFALAIGEATFAPVCEVAGLAFPDMALGVDLPCTVAGEFELPGVTNVDDGFASVLFTLDFFNFASDVVAAAGLASPVFGVE